MAKQSCGIAGACDPLVAEAMAWNWARGTSKALVRELCIVYAKGASGRLRGGSVAGPR